MALPSCSRRSLETREHMPAALSVWRRFLSVPAWKSSSLLSFSEIPSVARDRCGHEHIHGSSRQSVFHVLVIPTLSLRRGGICFPPQGRYSRSTKCRARHSPSLKRSRILTPFGMTKSRVFRLIVPARRCRDCRKKPLQFFYIPSAKYSARKSTAAFLD